MPIIKKRAYNAASRKLQAQETKKRIIAAACTLFEAKGFEKVTIEEIAQEATVSAPTIYALFQSKLGIVRTLMDEALSHEDFEALVRKVVVETSPARRLAIAATMARQLYDAERVQLGILQHAQFLDAALKTVEREREARRYQRQEQSFKDMVQLGGLAKGLDEQKARDILWAFTGRDVYRLLVLERGWSPDDYERWLAGALAKLLLKD